MSEPTSSATSDQPEDLGGGKPYPGKECGTCTMCCKVMGIKAIAKPPGVWCKECIPGKGCGIYETRPEACRTFYCAYRVRAARCPCPQSPIFTRRAVRRVSIVSIVNAT